MQHIFHLWHISKKPTKKCETRVSNIMECVAARHKQMVYLRYLFIHSIHPRNKFPLTKESFRLFVFSFSIFVEHTWYWQKHQTVQLICRTTKNEHRTKNNRSRTRTKIWSTIITMDGFNTAHIKKNWKPKIFVATQAQFISILSKIFELHLPNVTTNGKKVIQQHETKEKIQLFRTVQPRIACSTLLYRIVSVKLILLLVIFCVILHHYMAYAITKASVWHLIAKFSTHKHEQTLSIQRHHIHIHFDTLWIFIHWIICYPFLFFPFRISFSLLFIRSHGNMVYFLYTYFFPRLLFLSTKNVLHSFRSSPLGKQKNIYTHIHIPWADEK